MIDDTPEHLSDNLGMVQKDELIAGRLDFKSKAREQIFVCKTYQNIVDLFNEIKDLRNPRDLVHISYYSFRVVYLFKVDCLCRGN